MLPSTLPTLGALFTLSLTATTGFAFSLKPRDPSVSPALLDTRAACGEGSSLVCYGSNGGTSQDLDPEDIEYAAAYLRYLAGTSNNKLWTMPPEFECGEWTLPLFGAGTVLALAKHINPRTNSSVTYYDIARTIDGGEDATEDERAASLLGACGSNGGQLGIIVDSEDEAYHTADYVASKAKPNDIIVKLVRDPDFKGL